MPHHKEKLLIQYMSTKLVEYISCSNFQYTLIVKTEKRLEISQIGRILIFEVTTTWLCLKCCRIQDHYVHIREVEENETRIKTLKKVDFLRPYNQINLCK